MTVYYVAYLLLALVGVIRIGKSTTIQKRNQCLLIFAVLFLLVGLRHPSMGVDLIYGGSGGYLGRFTYIAELPWRAVFLQQISNYERGYILFNKLLSLLSQEQQILIVGCAAVSIGLILYAVFRESPSPVMSAFVFVGLPTFLLLYSGLRQGIALGICFVAIRYIEARKPVKFAVAVGIAALFHRSAWLFLVAYPIYYFPMKRSWRLLTCLMVPLFYLFRYPLFQIFSKLLKENAKVDNNNAIELFLVFCLVYIFCFLFSGEQKDTAGLKNLFFAACCIQALGGVNALVMRVGYYYMNSLILLLPMVLGRMRNRKNARILSVAIAICFLLFGLYSLRRSSWAQAYPYKWFWDNTI